MKNIHLKNLLKRIKNHNIETITILTHIGMSKIQGGKNDNGACSNMSCGFDSVNSACTNTACDTGSHGSSNSVCSNPGCY